MISPQLRQQVIDALRDSDDPQHVIAERLGVARNTVFNINHRQGIRAKRHTCPKRVSGSGQFKSVGVPSELHQAVKEAAQVRGITVAALLREMLTAGLGGAK